MSSTNCFLSVVSADYHPRGTSTIIAKGIEHPACPERSGYVRATLHIAGYVIDALPEDDYMGVTVTFVAHTDLRGKLPGMPNCVMWQF